MPNMNKVFIMGHAGKDPETVITKTGVKITTFTMATSEKWTDAKGEKVVRTEWHTIKCWKKQAETAEKYVKKGNTIMVEGRIRYNKFEKDGVTKYFTEIECDHITLIKAKDGQNGERKADENTAETEVNGGTANTEGAEGHDAEIVLPF